jgi:hypothetical protein
MTDEKLVIKILEKLTSNQERILEALKIMAGMLEVDISELNSDEEDK